MPLSRDTFTDIGIARPPQDFIWYHVVLTLYGNWLPGDPRGFRTRHHRQHVAGDYKSPPVHDFTGLRIESSLQMKHGVVTLNGDFQVSLGRALIERFQKLGGFVLTMAVTSTHIHVLAKLPHSEARNWIGLAKKHAWFEMRHVGWKQKLWAKRGKLVRIDNYAHQRNCFAYIVKHIRQDAWVWIWENIDDAVIERILRG